MSCGVSVPFRTYCVRGIVAVLVAALGMTGCSALDQVFHNYSRATPDPRFAPFTETLHEPVEVKHEVDSITSRMQDVHAQEVAFAAAYRNGKRDFMNELGNSYWFNAVIVVDQETIDLVKTLNNEGVEELPGIVPELHSYVPQECTFSFGTRDFLRASELLSHGEQQPFGVTELALSEDCQLLILRGEGE